MSDLQAYLDQNKAEILSFARGSKIDADMLGIVGKKYEAGSTMRKRGVVHESDETTI
jgi:hypothetical protein